MYTHIYGNKNIHNIYIYTYIYIYIKGVKLNIYIYINTNIHSVCVVVVKNVSTDKGDWKLLFYFLKSHLCRTFQ